ncbi:hypothetical protein [Geodermatophilus sp. DSM 44513]|uniref:hypothetical protein n=1 Tax=Geodermatophilus sp. DSM 44513 TaxID=1528104 RepID=UPI00128AA006|nr:hypothetical protein [Geodermatophilus sp. DSM 44513]WNV74418.1 hypothetical protein RTG05_15670 [Geodermatophilus sp. DSM 44513]
MSENDPDPYLSDEGHGRSELGGQPEPDAGDPTRGGRRGQIGETASVAADEPDDGQGYAVGGGRVTEDEDAPPITDPGPDA